MTETEWLPKASGYLIGQTIFDRLIYNAHADAGFARPRPTSQPPFAYLPTDVRTDTARLDLWQELSLPLTVGPVQLVPYAVADGTYYSRDVQAENVGVGSVARAGAQLSPTGPNNEGFPSSAPANGPSTEHIFGTKIIIDNNHLHANPYPNVGAAGQPRVCEAANETYEKGKAVVGNLPASSVGTTREITTREQDLYGEKYPASTLADLGLAKPAKAKKRGKRK